MSSAEISSLKFQLETLQHEKQLLEVSKTEEIYKLQQKYLAVNQDLQQASLAQTFLFNQNTTLSSRVQELEAQREAAEREAAQAAQQHQWLVAQLREQLLAREEEVKSLENTNSTIGAKLRVYEQDRTSLRAELRNQVARVLEENRALTGKVAELETKTVAARYQSQNEDKENNVSGSGSLNEEDFNTLNRNLVDQMNENTQLRSQILAKNLEIKDLKTDTTLVKLLEEEKRTLKNRVDFLERALQEQSAQVIALAQENLELKEEKERFVVKLGVVSETNEKKEKSNEDLLPLNEHFQYSGQKLELFIKAYRQFESQLAQSQAKVDFLQQELQNYRTITDEQAGVVNKSSIEIQKLQKSLEEAHQSNVSLTNKNLLARSEVNLLTKKIQSLEEFDQKLKVFESKNAKKTAEGSASDETISKLQTDVKAKEAQIGRLENTINEYVAQIQKLGSENPNKRQRIEEGGPVPTDNTLLASTESDDALLNKYHAEILRLRKEMVNVNELNSELSSRVHVCEQRLQQQQRYIDSLSKVKEQKQNVVRVLQLYDNPTAQYQKIKAEKLRALTAENVDLIKYVSQLSREIEGLKSGSGESTQNEEGANGDSHLIPKSVLGRYMVEVEANEKEIESLSKKLDRLRKVYNEKSSELIKTIALLFGYNVEFFSNSKKIKITPQLRDAGEPAASSDKEKVSGSSTTKMDIGSSDNYLVIDLHNKALQISSSASEYFSSKCEHLISYWVKTKGEIPCFLAALNLEIFEHCSLK